MKTTFKNSLILTLLAFCIPFGFAIGQDQQDNEEEKKPYKNTVRFNLTSPLIISTNYIVFGYERQLKNNQSFSVNAGQFMLPKFGEASLDSMNLLPDQKDYGINFSVDYRFYLKEINKFDAPRGVYVGPFASYNFFKRENTWEILTNSLNEKFTTDVRLNILSLGFEVGYQFVFWDRMTLDLIMVGAGAGLYNSKVKLSTTLPSEDESYLLDILNEKLADKLPGYDKMLSSGEFVTKGTQSKMGIGIRYVIHVGYRF